MLAERARLVDVLAALSLTTDLASGFPFERGLRAALVADGLARALELDPRDHRAAFLAALLRAIGWGHASAWTAAGTTAPPAPPTCPAPRACSPPPTCSPR